MSIDSLIQKRQRSNLIKKKLRPTPLLNFDWKILTKVLTYYCFEINNSFSSSLFKITRGVRQGCPVSPYLFILFVELMVVAIRTNNCIQGIKVDETEF